MLYVIQVCCFVCLTIFNWRGRLELDTGLEIKLGKLIYKQKARRKHIDWSIIFFLIFFF